MKISRHVGLVALGAVLSALGGGVIAIAAGGDDADPLATPMSRMEVLKQSVRPDGTRIPYPFTRASGLDPADAEYAFTTSRGKRVSVVSGNGVGCLLYDTGNDVCKPEEEIDAGYSLEIANVCSPGPRPMDIVGLVPSNVATVRLVYHDQSSVDIDVVERAFLFSGPTPAAGERYFVSRRWLGEDGSELATRRFPIDQGGYCPGP